MPGLSDTSSSKGNLRQLTEDVKSGEDDMTLLVKLDAKFDSEL
jgi:hypothetical protein